MTLRWLILLLLVGCAESVTLDAQEIADERLGMKLYETIDTQYPNLPEENKAELVETQLEQFKQTSNYEELVAAIEKELVE